MHSHKTDHSQPSPNIPDKKDVIRQDENIDDQENPVNDQVDSDTRLIDERGEKYLREIANIEGLPDGIPEDASTRRQKTSKNEQGYPEQTEKDKPEYSPAEDEEDLKARGMDLGRKRV